jgi:uncharacterized coiled-coil DUF342 family protein
METREIRRLDPKSLEPGKFKNIERLKEILQEAEPLHQTMVRLTKEYGDAVERIKGLAKMLQGKEEDDGRGD